MKNNNSLYSKVSKTSIIYLSFITALVASCSGKGGSSSSSTTSSGPDVKTIYNILYDLDGGVVTKGNPDTYTNYDDDFVLNKAYKEGYIFQGWSKNNSSDVNLNQVITKGTFGDLKFKAIYNVDYNSFGGKEVNVNPNGMKEFLELKDGETADYLKRFSSSSVTNPAGVTFYWKNINNASSMTFTLATDSDFKNVITSFETDKGTYTIYNLNPLQNYYVKVMDNTSDLIYKDSFKLDGHLRTIKMDGVTNMRDIGGWTIDDGSTIPFGKIYRSSDIQKVTTQGKETLKELGIKTEIDLRLEGQGSEAPISGMKFVNAGFWHWGHCFPGASTETPSDTTSINGLKKALKVYTNKSNYPIVAHCSGGADRTSTLYFVIEGLLGMEYEDMAREHELTTFSNKGLRLRCGTKYNSSTGKFEYDLTSKELDQSGFTPSFDLIYNHVLETYGSDGGTFKDAIENYTKTVLSLTDEEIQNIRNNILLNF